MTIPTSGQFTSEQVRAEWGFTAPFTSSQVSSAAGLNTPWTSDQLRGRSARTVTIQVASHDTIQTGFGVNQTRYDRLTFRVVVSDGLTPTSYQWSGDAFGTGSTGEFIGPLYNSNGWTFLATGYADVTVVIDGRTYTPPSRDFQYTASDIT